MTVPDAVRSACRHAGAVLAAVALAATCAVVAVATAETASASTAPPPASLPSGGQLRSGQSLVSNSGQLAVTMLATGDLVLTAQGGQLWHTGTAGHAGAWAIMQPDGNLVVYSAANAPLWNSHTSGTTGATAVLYDSGDFAVATATTTAWHTGTVNDTLLAGRSLRPGQKLVTRSGQQMLIMQTDGNLVLYRANTPLWSTRTNGNPGAWLVMQTDGNLVIYSATNHPLWWTSTVDRGTTMQVVDGNVYVHTASGGTAWYALASTGTGILASGARLSPGQVLHSASGQYSLTMQTDGNLVLTTSGTPWSTRTSGHPGAYLLMQTDGNLVLYTPSFVALWNSHTAGTGSYAKVGDDGSIGVFSTESVLVFTAPNSTDGIGVVDAAMAMRGKPYCYDGGNQNGPTAGRDAACAPPHPQVGFDCSGLALYAVYHAIALLLPHQSGQMWTQYAAYHGTRVARTALLPGDLVFFTGDDGTTTVPGHVGVYVGNNQLVDAQQSGVPVGIHTLYNGYIGGVRFWH